MEKFLQTKLAEIMTHSSTEAVNGALNGGLGLVYEEQMKLVHRMDGGLGLSIAGGTDSPPYNPDHPEEEGIFISKVTENGPADRAGLKRGDKLLGVNGFSTVGISHTLAVEYMKNASDAVSMKIARQVLKPQGSQTPEPRLNSSFGGDAEIVSTSIKLGPSGSAGFSIAGGKGASRFRLNDEGIYISNINHDGPADRDGKLKIGDRVLVINGTNVRDASHDAAVSLLLGGYDNEIHLVVQRDRVAPLTPLKADPTPLIEPPLAQSSPVASLQRGTLPPTSFNGGHPRPSLDESISPYPVETVTVKKVNGSLGLSIVGGSDHSHHPFGTPGPGVFVSKLVSGGGAAKSKKIKIGDRLLAVNGTDVSVATHEVVVQSLKNSTGKEVVLKIRHDPEPPGLKELTIKRKNKEPLGLNICGGVQSPPANPLDRTDEGIFIEEVHYGGAAARDGRLKAGMRILEVNDVSLLGCTQDDAAAGLKNSGAEVRLMVCEGFDPSLMSLPSVALAAAAVADARSKDSLNTSKEEGSAASMSSTTTSSMASPEVLRPTRHPPPPPRSLPPAADLPPKSPLLPPQHTKPTPPRHLPISAEVEEEFSRHNVDTVSPSGRKPIVSAPRPYRSKPLGPPKPITPTTGLSAAKSSSGLPTTSVSSFYSSGLSSPTSYENDPYSRSSYASSLAATSKSLPSLVVENQGRSGHFSPQLPHQSPSLAKRPPTSPPPVLPKPPRPLITGSSQLDSSTEETPTTVNPILQSRIPSAKTPEFTSPFSKSSGDQKDGSPGPKPEKLSFGSKLQKFEKEIVEHAPPHPTTTNTSKLPKPNVPPKKFALVSDSDVRRMKEEENRKPLPVLTPTTPDNNINSFLQSDVSRKPLGPSVVRTKKAENRLKAVQGEDAEPSLEDSATMSPAEKRAKEAELRRQWRADRLKSLEADALKAENIMKKVMKTSETIQESEQAEQDAVVGSEVEETRIQEVDPITGDIVIKTYHREQIVTKQQKETTETKVHTLVPDIGFIDDGSSQRSDANSQ